MPQKQLLFDLDTPLSTELRDLYDVITDDVLFVSSELPCEILERLCIALRNVRALAFRINALERAAKVANDD